MKVTVDILTQQVIVPDLLITELRDRRYAESLTRRGGVMLHFGISYAKMPYSRHYRSNELGGEIWEFSSIPYPDCPNKEEG